ncbi:MAG: NAD(P)H-hydrate dehydratase [Chloroflexi bacterium]|nr:NAD(P)H-hydrate dehydratase [Chloroflexota bacterium]
MKIVTADQMRSIEDRSEAMGVSKDALMERAGLETARYMRRVCAPLFGVPIVVLVGPGNNGGDGLVVARHLHRWGARVSVYICRDRRTPDPKLDIVNELEISVIAASDDEGLMLFRELLSMAHVVVDSVLGIGRLRPLEGTVRDILLMLAEARAAKPDMTVLAVDVPSGMDGDSGDADAACPAVDITLAMGYPKVGHYAYDAEARIGKLDVVEIGLPDGVDDDVPLSLMTDANIRPMLPLRPSDAHKGSFGRTMVVAGSLNYIGAAYLAGSAATRAGSGLVTIALPASIQMAVAGKATEPTYLPLAESSPGVALPSSAGDVLGALGDYSGLLIGCGLGQAADMQGLVETVLYSGEKLPPTVVDADGLNTLAHTPHWWERFPDTAILTPHPGEMARLTGMSTGEVQADRIGIAVESAALWNKVVVLKGAHTVVAYPDGRAMLSPFANPGLATAGTGDVLAGSIAGLLSQGVQMEEAAALGVYLHGMVGESVRGRLGDTGMVASDLLPELPLAIRSLGEGDGG